MFSDGLSIIANECHQLKVYTDRMLDQCEKADGMHAMQFVWFCSRS
jgi:hypothetical protein